MKPLRNLSMKATNVSIGLAICLASVTGTAQAGLKEAMNKMFVSTSTQAQAINSQRLNGMYGGSMSLRPVGSGINIVQFALPRIEAGCGGIDMFFGSFSFINGAQFEQLIRSIAAGAVGYAIKAAIGSMCNPCGNYIEGLEQAMRALNAMAKNTCAIGAAIAGDENAQARINEQTARLGRGLSVAVNGNADNFKAENWRLFNTTKDAARGGDSEGAGVKNAIGENNPLNGNLVFRAANESLDNGANTLKAFLSKKDIIRVIMGLYGVTIINPDGTDGTKCPKDAPPEKCSEDPQKYAPSITKWQMLMEPRKYNEDGVKVKECLNAACTRIDTGTLSLAEWGGVTDAVHTALFGTPYGMGPPSQDSIVGAFVHKVPPTVSSLNQYARAVTTMLSIPVLNMMEKVQDIPGAPETLGYQLEGILPEYFAYQLAMEFHSIGANVFSGQTKVDMPANYAANLKDKSDELNTMKPDGMRLFEIMNKSSEALINIRRLTRGAYTDANVKK
ncbi:conjugal transfer protein TraH [Diaphorobacter sp. J5-51]|uniref:conjugal transfer protein TraH n=1 Tax=Diaphorobacter sp. J5-51 TaxID=680496 RepID=UPI000A072234|nr:conjugal transfer protein TraH [Diaphorobacter sp. J5-51]